MAAGDLFKRAAAYRKKHPGMSMPEAVKAMSKGSKPAKKKPVKKKAAVGKVRKKRAVKKTAAKKAAPRKVKVKIKGGKKGGATVRIGSTHTATVYKTLKSKGLKLPHGYAVEKRTMHGMSMGKITQEHTHQAHLHSHIKKHQATLKTKGMLKAAKDLIRREIKAFREQIAASKKHVSVLKRSI